MKRGLGWAVVISMSIAIMWSIVWIINGFNEIGPEDYRSARVTACSVRGTNQYGRAVTVFYIWLHPRKIKFVLEDWPTEGEVPNGL